LTWCTRTLLVNLPDPAAVAAEMVRLAKPGGWVASMEPDTEYVRCYPPHDRAVRDLRGGLPPQVPFQDEVPVTGREPGP
jgi:hypothetical protein